MNHVCRIIENKKSFISLMRKESLLMNHIHWMTGTAWNLGLYCLSVGKQTEGSHLFHVLNKVNNAHLNRSTISLFITLAFKCS